MPLLLPQTLLARRNVDLPVATRTTFSLQGAPWEFPTYENADTLLRA